MTVGAIAGPDALFDVAGLLGQFIDGRWREGLSEKVLMVTYPFDDDTLADLRLVTVEDLDEACRAAEAAQKQRAAQPSGGTAEDDAAGRGVARRAPRGNHRLVVKESGSTVIKANVEVSAATGITLEVVPFPGRCMAASWNRTPREGKLGLPAAPGRGRSGNFPLHLSQRSVAPALAQGNAVVIKPAQRRPGDRRTDPGEDLRRGRTARRGAQRHRRIRI